MIGYECAIYQKDRFCLGPLADQGADSQEQFTRARLRNQLIHQPTKVTHNCLTDLTNDRLVKLRTIENGCAKEPIDWERLSNRPNNRQRTIKQRTENICLARPRTIEQQRPSKWTTKTDGSVRPNAIGRLTEKSTKQLRTTVRQSRESLQIFEQTQRQLRSLLTSEQGLEPVRVLDQGLEIWNRPGA